MSDIKSCANVRRSRPQIKQRASTAPALAAHAFRRSRTFDWQMRDLAAVWRLGPNLEIQVQSPASASRQPLISLLPAPSMHIVCTMMTNSS